MRYLHYEVDEICNYTHSRCLAVSKCDFENKVTPVAVSIDAIEEMLKRSETLWGLALPYYLSIAKSVEANSLTLKEAVEQVEASPSADRFLLVAYQDAGVISVSGVALPFQIAARDAKWWAPYKSASRSLS
ncbi:MAG: hypothetical protein JSR91_02955 [Proteobacteria bacterium]|nr:hypothetical protein [Pseudomonadota bacterium]